MIRSLRSMALGAALALSLGGCSQNGSYRLSWDFYPTPTGGPIESAAVGCGQHGVDFVSANGTDETGDVIQVTAICPPGAFTGTAPNGLWTFQFHIYDARGTEIVPRTDTSPPAKMTIQPAAQPIASEGATAAFSVTFVPRAACGDGIDNDGDGLVDTAGTECDAGSSGPLDGGPGTPDSGATGTGDGAVGDAGATGAPVGGDAGAQDAASSGARG
ncbi:MAG TPA: hypothetical protein VN853_05365 [Polyangia bacterium]|nr:hypothetical protein [Polyangia bacterium]